MTIAKLSKLGGALFAAGMLLAGCSQSGINEVQQWMSAEEKKMKGKVEPVSEPKPFKAFKYEAEKEVDPFNASKVTALVDANKNKPRGGSEAKAWTEVSTPERTRKVPSRLRVKAMMASRTVQA